MQIRSSQSRLFVVLSLLLTPWVAQAHPGFHAAGFLHGMEHPLSGLDHICAMIAVGLWGAQRGGKAVWMVPLAFVTMMLFGGLLGISGVVVPQVELGIALSVLIFGVLVAVAAKLPMWLSAAVVGLFAIFHGYAHTIETPMNVSAMTYDVGFILSTSLLHIVGIGFGLAVARFGKISFVRFAGGAIACCGVFLLAN